MKKAIYLDTETTGLNSWKNDIIQIAFLIEIDGIIKEEYESKVAPFNFENVDEEALKINGYTVADLKTFPRPQDIYKEITDLMGKYCNKFDKGDKFSPAGYNVRFDVDFIKNFFKKNGDNYYGSWFNWKLIDPMYTLYEMDYSEDIGLRDYKLSTVCEHFKINIKAHDALSDIRATRELRYILQSK